MIARLNRFEILDQMGRLARPTQPTDEFAPSHAQPRFLWSFWGDLGKSVSNCLSPCLCISCIWVLDQFIVLVCVSNVIFKTYPYDCIYKHRWFFKNWKWLFFFGFGTITIVLSVSTIILIRVGYCWNFYLTMFWRYYGILLLLKFLVVLLTAM